VAKQLLVQKLNAKIKRHLAIRPSIILLDQQLILQPQDWRIGNLEEKYNLHFPLFVGLYVQQSFLGLMAKS